ncbi:MAG: ABC transporter ATP-binding protein [Candidatus Rokubacteria bacterium RIFCSPLOWO2_02_FULL_68_19]|nr:MAG: ABC transporter ATP-binding protein [Candidatus Rokubacteria bacterium RIFCSPLOWO2_02_FULL_68_19]
MGEVAAVTRLLETTALSKTFGGLEAVRRVDFRLERGEIRAIIGPNGAGKTTLVSMISGRIGPTSGRVLFKGRDITGLKAWDRVALGIVYTFQVTSIFKNLTVYENVALAAQRRLMKGALGRLTLPQHILAEPVNRALAQVGLADVGEQDAGSLPYGHQKLLEVAMALALRPEMLILDEPTQGLAPEEITALSLLIRALSRGVTILLIEHNMAVVLDLATKVTVMDKGGLLAEGTPHEIETHPDVQKVYLGL